MTFSSAGPPAGPPASPLRSPSLFSPLPPLRSPSLSTPLPPLRSPTISTPTSPPTSGGSPGVRPWQSGIHLVRSQVTVDLTEVLTATSSLWLNIRLPLLPGVVRGLGPPRLGVLLLYVHHNPPVQTAGERAHLTLGRIVSLLCLQPRSQVRNHPVWRVPA